MSPDVSHCLLTTRLSFLPNSHPQVNAVPAPRVPGDRLLSFIGFLEAIVRLTAVASKWSGGAVVDYHTVSVITNVSEMIVASLLGAHDSRPGQRGHGSGHDSIRDLGRGHGQHPKASPSLRGLEYIVSKVRAVGQLVSRSVS